LGGEFKMSEKGVVERWFNKKGYGFIKSDKGESVFVHYSGVRSEDSFKKLEEGQRVKFDIEEGKKGPKAVNVVVLEDAPSEGEEPAEEMEEEAPEEEEMEEEAPEEEEPAEEMEEEPEEEPAEEDPEE